MTRLSAAAAISIFLALFTPLRADAQSDQDFGFGTRNSTVCEGGRVTDGRCACPAGFELMADSVNSHGGTCVKSHTEDCLGGALTVDGRCLCNGQVVMSGETYLLEPVRGKCVPRQCPVQTLLRDGKCVATSADAPATSPDLASPKPAPPKEAAKETAKEGGEEAEHRYRCGRGMVPTRSGCAAAHRKHHYSLRGSLSRYYYRMRYPGYSY